MPQKPIQDTEGTLTQEARQGGLEDHTESTPLPGASFTKAVSPEGSSAKGLSISPLPLCSYRCLYVIHAAINSLRQLPAPPRPAPDGLGTGSWCRELPRVPGLWDPNLYLGSQDSSPNSPISCQWVFVQSYHGSPLGRG